MRQKILDEGGDERMNSVIDESSILSLLPMEIQLETSDVTFDHYNLHIVCWKLLRELHETLGGCLPGWSEVHLDDRSFPGFALRLLASGPIVNRWRAKKGRHLRGSLDNRLRRMFPRRLERYWRAS